MATYAGMFDPGCCCDGAECCEWCTCQTPTVWQVTILGTTYLLYRSTVEPCAWLRTLDSTVDCGPASKLVLSLDHEGFLLSLYGDDGLMRQWSVSSSTYVDCMDTFTLPDATPATATCFGSTDSATVAAYAFGTCCQWCREDTPRSYSLTINETAYTLTRDTNASSATACAWSKAVAGIGNCTTGTRLVLSKESWGWWLRLVDAADAVLIEWVKPEEGIVDCRGTETLTRTSEGDCSAGVVVEQQFDASGTWTAPAGVELLLFKGWGGGGGGGGGGSVGGTPPQGGGGAGGGGAFARKYIKVVPTTLYGVKVASTAAGGSGVSNGTDGDFSAFQINQGVAVGGKGGQSRANGITGGLGGAAGSCTADVAYSGGAGGDGQSGGAGTPGGGGGGSAGDSEAGGDGGDANAPTPGLGGGGGIEGGGNGATGGASGANGGNGTQPGGGGGGGGWALGTTTGGTGAAGRVIIRWVDPSAADRRVKITPSRIMDCCPCEDAEPGPGDPAACANGCCTLADSTNQYDVDLGAGGWTGDSTLVGEGRCDACEDIVGVYTVTRATGIGFGTPCRWHYIEENICQCLGTTGIDLCCDAWAVLVITLSLEDQSAVGEGACIWVATVRLSVNDSSEICKPCGLTGPGLIIGDACWDVVARYESAAQAVDDPCDLASPLLLTKVSEPPHESMVYLCNGALPSTITIQSV